MNTYDADVVLSWSLPYRDRDDPRWNYSLGLYAYLRPRGMEILYIGKVYGCTVWQRLGARDKKQLWVHLERNCGIRGIRVIVGEFRTTLMRTRQLVQDVESLLIYSIKPCCNIQARTARNISRPGLVVRCQGGAWPHPHRTFRDE